jgi:hypothetical protein
MSVLREMSKNELQTEIYVRVQLGWTPRYRLQKYTSKSQLREKMFPKPCFSLAIFSAAYTSPTVSHCRACCQDEIQADNLPRWQRISGFYNRKIKKKSHKLTYFSRMCCKQIQVNCEASQSIFTHEFRLRTTKSICAPKKAQINFKVRKCIHTRNRLPLPYVRG